MHELFSKFMEHMSNMLTLINLYSLVWYGHAPKVVELQFTTIILSVHTLPLLTSWETAEDQNLNEGFLRTVIIDRQLWLMLGILSITRVTGIPDTKHQRVKNCCILVQG